MENKIRKPKNLFIQGPVTPAFIADAIAKHADKTDIGAHQIFLGQIRADVKEGRTVQAIEFSAYEAMANEQYSIFRETLFSKYPITCMHVYHSLGEIKAGEINLFVFVSSPHRDAAIKACSELVEWIKKELPVWGKELYDDGSTYDWKVNQ